MKISKQLGLILFGMAILAAGCGGGSSSSSVVPSSRSYLGTQAPGDVWSWNFDSGTFTASNQTLGHNYTGTVSDLPSGFRKLTIGTSNDSNVTVGSSGYAIEIPGTALLIKPSSVGSAPIVACGLGSNAANGAQLHYNWVAVPRKNADFTQDGCFGTVDFAVSGNTYNGDIKNFKFDGTLSHESHDGFTNANGELTVLNGGTGAMTPSGTFMLDFGPNNGGAIGVVQPAQAIDVADFCLANRQFRGILMRAVDPTDPTNPHNGAQCIYGVAQGGNILKGGNYTDVEAGTKDDLANGVVITIDSQPTNGMLRGTLTENHDNSSHPIYFAINKVGGKYTIFGLGTDSGGYNLALIEQ